MRFKYPQKLGEIREIAADAVELVDQYPADRIRPDCCQQRAQGRAVGILAGKAAVAVNADGLIRGELLPAELLLRFQRNAVGTVRRLPHIDRGMLHETPPHGQFIVRFVFICQTVDFSRRIC